jgi:hypothetical protein
MTPTSILQYADDSNTQIPWRQDNLNFLVYPSEGGLTTVNPLSHIARSPKLDITNQTWLITATGFKFNNLPATILGISVTLKMNRGGRISDNVIQLCYQGRLIGNNYAQIPYDDHLNQSYLTDITHYGSINNTWNVTNLTPAMLQDTSFGITMQFKSHPMWPHKTTPILYSVDIQIS